MADVTIVSIPRTGTHFLLWLTIVHLRLAVQFIHFTSSAGPLIKALLKEPPHPIIVTSGNRDRVESEFGPDVTDEFYRDMAQHRGSLLANGGVDFDINGHDLDPVLAALGVTKTPAIDKFIAEWPIISPSNPSQRLTALQAMVNDRHRMWV